MVADAAPCTTSTLSIVLTSKDCKLVDDTSTPSTIINGEVPPCNVLIPLNKIDTSAPGLPDADDMVAPAILPINAWEAEAGRDTCFSKFRDSTDIATFLLSVATPTPVTTTSVNSAPLLAKAILSVD